MSNLVLKVDNRERKIIKLLNGLNEQENTKINFEIEKLDIGDFILELDGKEIIILERKSLNDIAASICDGRYREQSFRLANFPLHNHNIIYIIEGNIQSWKSRISRIKSDTIYSTILSIQLLKGFSTMKTNDTYETAIYLRQLFLKVNKEVHLAKKPMFYLAGGSGSGEGQSREGDNSNDKVEGVEEGMAFNSHKDYVSVVSKVKKNNITNKNIGMIILSQIPGISCNTSAVIIEKFGSLYNVLENLKKDPTCLDELTYKTTKGQLRRISKTSIRNISQYLLEGKTNIIKIAT